ncbi:MULTISPECIES: hypothetical protein [Mesorhizobium]|uniref:hypothetical protein n=1 Tax=Mesorhizobium TaxID=68287 RepID=UPI0013DFFC3D|nr:MULTISPECIES: hypothetical protein [Mesorhizobium]MCF6122574.1 hypothetical protein [Mesorhizobium ciceri]MCQ8815589.1 hypothetical protein [Mesorhizobium sp. SEMIA396]MCQ8872508.1 hypothetical protein [Mesorhizobium sp. LMG17149]
MDDDLQAFDRYALNAELKKLRAGIRQHLDSAMRGCIHYRQSLDNQAPDAPIHDKEFNG